MKSIRTIALTVAAAAASLTVVAPSAYAGGKAASGCGTGGFMLGRYVTEASGDALAGDIINVASGLVEQRTHAALASLLLDSTQVVAVYGFVDHNGNGLICYKLPNGWEQGNTDNATAFLFNLADDKILL